MSVCVCVASEPVDGDRVVVLDSRDDAGDELEEEKEVLLGPGLAACGPSRATGMSSISG